MKIAEFGALASGALQHQARTRVRPESQHWRHGALRLCSPGVHGAGQVAPWLCVHVPHQCHKAPHNAACSCLFSYKTYSTTPKYNTIPWEVDSVLRAAINHQMQHQRPVADLFYVGTRQWNTSLIRSFFDEQSVEAIQSIVLLPETQEDRMFWRLNKSGMFTVMGTYLALQLGKLEQVDTNWKDL